MAITPVHGKWSYQLTTSESATFTIEDTALATTNAVYNPVLRFHNMGSETFSLVIVYNMDLGSATSDPLNSGTYTTTVVDVIVAANGLYDYDFGGIQLDNNEDMHVTHVVTIQNLGASTHVCHALLFGRTEVQTPINAGHAITWTS